MTKLEELEAALAAATPGEWDWHLGTAVEQDDFATVELHPEHDPKDTVILLNGEGDQASNVEFIALAHNAMPALLALAPALEKAITALNTVPNFKIPAFATTSYKLLPELEKALKELQ